MRDLLERYQPDAEVGPQRDDQSGVTRIDMVMSFSQLLDMVRLNVISQNYENLLIIQGAS